MLSPHMLRWKAHTDWMLNPCIFFPSHMVSMAFPTSTPWAPSIFIIFGDFGPCIGQPYCIGGVGLFLSFYTYWEWAV